MNKTAKAVGGLFAAAAITTGVLFLTSTGPKTWNVTPTGTGNNSLVTAEQNAQPGDTVSLTGTFHASLVPKVAGTASAPITYTAGTGGATFDATGMTAPLASISRSYITVSGLRFTNSAYLTAPATNRGVIVRSDHATFSGNSFTYMTMQLIGASFAKISGNTWREFVASYVNGKPQTSGDMLYLVSGSHDNEIVGNDMKYAGHALIEIGTGWGPTNANNWIHGNTLSNPWYRNIALADDGAGSIIENNQLLDANSVPTLYSTIAGQVGTLKVSSNAIQIIGQHFIVRNNTILNAVAQKGVIQLGGWWYYGAGAPTGGVMVQAQNNQVYSNTIQNSKGAAALAIEQDYTPGTDKAIPNITANIFRDNIVSSMTSSGAYSWDKTFHYETVLFRSFKGATVWVGMNGNQFYNNIGFSPTNSYRYSYVNGSNATTTKVYSLVQFNAFDPTNVYGNS